VKGKAQGAINANFLTALALHETLHLFGLTYSADPIPTAAANGPATDYIQFPRQTLEYKGGKCSDLSVLYSALLESAGTETAFITVPGHIFMAFSLGVSPDEARKDFSHPDELIFRYGKSWVPIEVTESAGFLEAWRDGAKEWRENLRTDQADFYPLHEAWQVYEPVGLPGAGATVILPPSEEIVDRYRNEIAAFVTQEITYRIAALRQQTKTPEDQRKLGNATGVLYAKYGLFDRAQQEFDKLIAEEEYVPALVNMGNTYFATGEKEKALEYYRRAYVKDPGDPKAVLAFARANHDLENYYEAKKVYADLKSQDSALARQFAYLDLKGEEATRQAEISGVAGVLIWDQ
jgi:tetratricopeptide (TPR) repeat protein